ncbi:DNA polymerase III subunit delta [Vagococcus coleopterorum]|uniref:DNA polymerase III subunit delta n=1 Tax=Vagococcus coleopterorum TaxID=2714946 RepID=A0A6G8AMW1_9ENTE|nr:DNA polymerase III subunit delta [Vagococcus coleopterorum]QIL46310.1 DNA polymerase III subunit delta [Vagococcus coleopterorum]
MSLQETIKKVNSGQLASVYLVLGTEQFLADRFKQALQKQIILTEDDELNSASFDMAESLLGAVIDEANTIPFFGDKRLVAIENPYFLTGEKKKIALEHNTDELIAYLEEPSDSTVLVFYAPYEKLDERKKVVKQLKKVATLVDVKEMQENDVRKYVQQYIHNEGYEITPEAFDLFVHLTDMDLSKIMSELNKVMLYSSDTKKITKPMIADLVPKTLEHNIFDMVNYVTKGQAEDALSLYRDLLLQGEETIKINAILIGQFRLLLQVKIMQGAGYQQSNMQDVIKVHPYRLKMAQQQARGFDEVTLKAMFQDLVENDYRIKTGALEKDLLFELFLLKHGNRK